MDIFEFFAARRTPATIQEVGSALGYPHSSATNILNSLRNRGYLSFDPAAKTYIPNLKLLMLSRWLVEEPAFTAGLTRLQQQLQRDTDETVFLAAREEGAVCYLQVLSSAAAVRLTVPSGTRRPLHRTATGIVLLAELPPSAREEALERSLDLAQEQDRVAARRRAQDNIARALDQGWFMTRGDMTSGAAVVALTLPRLPDAETLALGVGAPIERLDAKLDDILRQLRETTGMFLKAASSD